MEYPDFDVFEERFKPILNPNEMEAGNETFLFETYGKDWDFVKATDPKYVWTVVEAEGSLYLAPGFHIVNRLNYIITELPIEDYLQDYLYWDEKDMDDCN